MTKTLRIPHLNVAPLFKSLLTLLAFLVLGTAQAQVAGYIYDDSLEADTGFPYTPIVGTDAVPQNFGQTTNTTLSNNNVPIGFNFVFNGVTYSSCKVSANGFIAFGGTQNLATNAFTSNNIGSPNTNQFVGSISAYATAQARRLVEASFGSTPIYLGVPSSVQYTTTGAPGSQVFVVQWENVARYANNNIAPLPGILNFQIRLYEGTNEIQIHYKEMDVLPTNSGVLEIIGQVGLRGVANTDFNTRRIITGWGASADGDSNGRGFNTRNDSYPSYTYRCRWTPPCFAPGVPSVALLSPTSANVNWSAGVAPSDGYDWMVVSGGGDPNVPDPLNIEASGNTTNNFITPLTGLPGGTAMVFWVRSNCGGGSASDWIPSGSFTTSCDPTNVPYFVGFTGAQLPNIMPPCTSQVAVAPSSPWVVADGQPGMTGRSLQYTQSGANAANAWFFTQGVNLVAGQAYRISYRYGSQDFASISNRMEVRYGTAASVAGMTTQIDNHPNFRGSPFLNTAVFVAPATDVYYFGFRVYSIAGQGNVWLDDILVEESNCTQPQNVTVGTISSNGAFLSWDPVVPSPTNGYQYFVSTVATPPTPSTPPTGTVATNFINLTGLLGSTQYYFWVRSNCSATERSIWSLVETFTTLAPIPYCIPVANTTAPNQSFITNFTTTGGLTNINNSSTGYATSNGYSDFTQFSVTQVIGGAVGFSLSQTGGGHGIAIWVDWNQDGIFQASERVFNTTGYQFATNQTGTFNVPAGALLGNTRMRVMNDWIASNPNNPCQFDLYGLPAVNRRGEAEDYTFIVAPAPPVLTLSANSSTQCAGDSSPVISISSFLGDYNSYVWTPSTGVTDLGGGSYQFAANSTVTYILTASQSSFPFSINTVSFTYNAIAPPTPITITPASAEVCETGPAVALTATGGIVSGVVALEETFNGGAPEWDFINNSTGGDSGPAFAAWTIRNSPYVVDTPTNFWGSAPFISNDNSAFAFTNSDAQGDGAITNTQMISPVFSLAGYTNASLSFWHYYFQFDSVAVVEISTDGGLTWPAGQILQTFTASQGTRNNFVNVVINLNSYTGVGFDNLRLRFRYNALWGFGWAIDNVRIEGAAATQVFWSPAAGLFTNPAGTIPYNPAVAATTVYALPTANTTYTATVATLAPYGCTTTQTVEVTRNVVTAGTLPGSTTFCATIPNDLVLTGHVGTVVRWESATNAAFTAGVTSIPNTTAVLTGAEMLPISDFKYFRAIVNNGTCESPSSVGIVLLESNTFNGTNWSNIDPPYSGERAIFNVVGNYTVSSDLEACSLIITSGNITVAGTATLILQNELVVAPGATLTFQNNASLVQVFADEPNVGNIVYRRNSTGMFLLDYTYWSSPVVNQDLFTFSPFTHFMRKYDWNEATQTWRQLFPNIGAHVPGTVFSTAGRGFIVRAPGSGPVVFNSHLSGDPRVVFPAQFEGVPINGTITVPTSNVAPGWNLLGNPYPSALDVHAFLIDPANAHLDRTVKYWTHNTPITANVYNNSDYATYNFTGSNVTDTGTGTPGNNSGFTPNLTPPTRYMASGQGFVIDVLGGPGPGQATFRNSHRAVTNNNVFFRMAATDYEISAADAVEQQERHRIWLTMSNLSNLEKSLLVGYVENATNAYDNGYDGKFTASGYGLEFYSLIESQPLTIQGRGLPFAVSDTVPLGFFAQQAGSYTVSLAQWDGLFQNQEVYLEDLLTGVIHPLKESNYSFVTETGRFDQRFVLRYTNETLNVNTPHFDENNIVVYKQDGKLYVQTQGVAMSQVVLYDISGRRLVQQQGELGTLVGFDAMAIAQQVLLVEITTLDRGTVLKKYVY